MGFSRLCEALWLGVELERDGYALCCFYLNDST
jgi:hypothetical protein